MAIYRNGASVIRTRTTFLLDRLATCSVTFTAMHHNSNMIRISPYSLQSRPYSATVKIRPSFWERPQASYLCQAHAGLTPANFTVLSVMFSSIKHVKLHFINLPYRYFNESLVLYSDFSDSRQTGLFEFSSQSVVSHTTHITGLFFHRKRLLYASHKDSAFGLIMMIHYKARWKFLPSPARSLLSKRQFTIQYPELFYLA